MGRPVSPVAVNLGDFPSIRRILFASHHCYLDDSNGAAVASREMMQALARRGFGVEVLSGSMLDLDEDYDPRAWVAGRFAGWEQGDDRAWTLDARGVQGETPDSLKLDVRGVPVTVHLHATTRPHNPHQEEGREFLRLFEEVRRRFRPDVVVGYGGSRLAGEVFRRARASGIATVFMLHNLHYGDRRPFADVDHVCVPSRFAAGYYGKALGLRCRVLPNLVDRDRVEAGEVVPRFTTFVNPSFEKGVLAFARMAEGLGERRPEIPLLVVEARGTERTLASCGLDLRVHGNVFLMAHTADPRRFWGKTRVCLMPSLWWENQPLVAVEAMINGIPVIGSDRGGIPETLGDAGIVLPLPDRQTPSTRTLPTAEEVAPWVEAIIRLWDDPGFFEEHRRRAREEARRWDAEVLEAGYSRFFSEIRPGSSQAPSRAWDSSGLEFLLP
ncbi:glycosyltransferase [Tautonia rosea]|uniref:glycosyltransferase n=1 Tax=Tautonia rosea TaxID=2728037 RepID=UPI001474F98B|nr:glycosyltransferase [Tautonia rosea]